MSPPRSRSVARAILSPRNRPPRPASLPRAIAIADRERERPRPALPHEAVADEFLRRLRVAIVAMYGDAPATSPFFGRVVNARAQARAQDILARDRTYVVHGGEGDAGASAGGLPAGDEMATYTAPTVLDFRSDEARRRRERRLEEKPTSTSIARVRGRAASKQRWAKNGGIVRRCVTTRKGHAMRVSRGRARCDRSLAASRAQSRHQTRRLVARRAGGANLQPPPACRTPGATGPPPRRDQNHARGGGHGPTPTSRAAGRTDPNPTPLGTDRPRPILSRAARTDQQPSPAPRPTGDRNRSSLARSRARAREAAFDASAAMEEEVFAPIIPVLRVRDVDAAVAYIAKRSVGGAKPLSVYAFAEACVWGGDS